MVLSSTCLALNPFFRKEDSLDGPGVGKSVGGYTTPHAEKDPVAVTEVVVDAKVPLVSIPRWYPLNDPPSPTAGKSSGQIWGWEKPRKSGLKLAHRKDIAGGIGLKVGLPARIRSMLFGKLLSRKDRNCGSFLRGQLGVRSRSS